MLNKDLVKTKIRSIQEYLSEVEPILSLPKEEIISNIEKLRTLERNFQLIVDAMLDVNIHFIRELELGSPDALKSTFLILAASSDKTNSSASKNRLGVNSIHFFGCLAGLGTLIDNFPHFFCAGNRVKAGGCRLRSGGLGTYRWDEGKACEGKE